MLCESRRIKGHGSPPNLNSSNLNYSRIQQDQALALCWISANIYNFGHFVPNLTDLQQETNTTALPDSKHVTVFWSLPCLQMSALSNCQQESSFVAQKKISSCSLVNNQSIKVIYINKLQTMCLFVNSWSLEICAAIQEIKAEICKHKIVFNDMRRPKRPLVCSSIWC